MNLVIEMYLCPTYVATEPVEVATCFGHRACRSDHSLIGMVIFLKIPFAPFEWRAAYDFPELLPEI